MLKEAIDYTRMAAQMPRWIRIPLEPRPADAVRRNLGNRETNFLTLLRRGIFENPVNPYHELFQWAGCALGDLEAMVRGNGLEPALERLRQAGVYLSHDEFKGKIPVIRGGKQLVVETGSFANPRVSGVLESCSSGSRSRGITTRSSFENQAYREAQERVLMAEYESGGRALVILANILPALDGIRRVVDYGRRGRPPDKWFVVGGGFRTSGHYQLVTQFLLLELRALGFPAIFPEFLPHNDFSPIARWIAHRKREGRPSLLVAGVSRGVRVAASAVALGLDIAGTTFILGGEALTGAKRAVVENAGCEAHARYTISELGRVGMGCGGMVGNCVHLCRDSLAVISRRRVAPLTDVEVDSLMFTALLPSAPHVVVNVEMDDAGILGPARCGCPLTDLGLTQQIDKIYSYGKLTGHGTSLLRGDLLNILESKLPARFGGIPADYQLVELEGAAQTEIELRVHPRIRSSPEEIKRYFLSEVKRLWSGALTCWVWVRTEGVKVVIAEPYVTGTHGKVNPLHLLGNAGRK